MLPRSAKSKTTIRAVTSEKVLMVIDAQSLCTKDAAACLKYICVIRCQTPFRFGYSLRGSCNTEVRSDIESWPSTFPNRNANASRQTEKNDQFASRRTGSRKTDFDGLSTTLSATTLATCGRELNPQGKIFGECFRR